MIRSMVYNDVLGSKDCLQARLILLMMGECYLRWSAISEDLSHVLARLETGITASKMIVNLP